MALCYPAAFLAHGHAGMASGPYRRMTKDLLHLRGDPYLKQDPFARKKWRLGCAVKGCSWYTSMSEIDDDRLNAAVLRRNRHIIQKHNERMPWG
jgi:hypothetical protein